LITHEAAQLATSEVRDKFRVHWFIASKEDHQLYLGVHIGFLLLQIRKPLSSLGGFATFSQNCLSRSVIQVQIEYSERLLQREWRLRRIWRRNQKGYQDELDLREAWEYLGDVQKSLVSNTKPGK
jgi:hypothetical protein